MTAWIIVNDFNEIKVEYTVHAGLDLIQSWALFFDVDFKRLFLWLGYFIKMF